MRILKKHQGLRPYRYRDNPLEQRFASEWQNQNNHILASTLAWVLSVDGSINPQEPTQEQRIVANTIIQWLGTNVGQAFLETVLRSKEGQVFLKQRLGVEKIDGDKK